MRRHDGHRDPPDHKQHNIHTGSLVITPNLFPTPVLYLSLRYQANHLSLTTNSYATTWLSLTGHVSTTTEVLVTTTTRTTTKPGATTYLTTVTTPLTLTFEDETSVTATATVYAKGCETWACRL